MSLLVSDWGSDIGQCSGSRSWNSGAKVPGDLKALTKAKVKTAATKPYEIESQNMQETGQRKQCKTECGTDWLIHGKIGPL